MRQVQIHFYKVIANDYRTVEPIWALKKVESETLFFSPILVTSITVFPHMSAKDYTFIGLIDSLHNNN